MRISFPLQIGLLWGLAAAVVGVPFWLIHEREVDAYLERERVQLQAALRSTDRLLRTMTNQAFADVLGRGRLREVLTRPFDGRPGQASAFYRDAILEVGREAHRSLRTCCGASLHVLDASGASLVHFDARLREGQAGRFPERAVAPELMATRFGAQGFEVRRTGLAYRRILPIWDEQQLVGGVEAVLQPGDLVTLLRRIGSQALLYHILLRRDALPPALETEGGSQRFQDTELHPGLVEPIQTGSLGSRLPHWFQKSRSLRHALADGYADNDPVGALVRDAYGRHVAVAMVPVEDMAGRPLGYAVSESGAGPIIAWRNQMAVSAGVVFLLVGALSNVAVLMVRWRRGARALREQMHAITESMGEGVYVLDATGRVGYVNQAASAMLGYRPDEITGAKANALFYDSSGAQGRPTRIPGWDVLRTGGTYRSDRHELRRRDGTSLPVSLTVSPLQGVRRGVVAVFHDIADRARELSSLKEQAARDPLTGLGNRRMLDSSLQRESARARRTGNPLSLLMLDVDEFKLFNDTFGHPAGDHALCRIAAILEASVNRPSDLICRYGGEEFAVILPVADAEAAAVVAERIRVAVERAGIRHTETASRRMMTVSVGCATAVGMGAEPALLIARADAGVYRAKNRGRNRVEGVAEPGISL
ncbi:diguanylate cyclase [Aquisalimonas lutea]|uniref:sensor domain-containing diguanylate cyclase n=1 Tax=Aquisalimonas lutea TaxID=1327750 RepID=UPI0025B40D2C|nr:diguanylate cyclase [Aquisalimonas lutea]MDN3519610.1 diguanylate cyclase [Aquisalimonas lutea]